jgi:cytidine deaminase
MTETIVPCACVGLYLAVIILSWEEVWEILAASPCRECRHTLAELQTCHDHMLVTFISQAERHNL